MRAGRRAVAGSGHPHPEMSISLFDFMRKAKTALGRCPSRPDPTHNHDVVKMLKQVIMNQQELAAGIKTLTAQQGKIAKEQSDRFDVLTAKIDALEKAIAAGDVQPEVTTAFTELQAAAQSLDDAIPDAPTT